MNFKNAIKGRSSSQTSAGSRGGLMLTMATLPRALNCDGSLVLPRAELHSEHADADTQEHNELARQVVAGALPARLARIVPGGSRPELTVCYDISTGEGRIVREDEAHNAAFERFEVRGKANVVGLDGDTVVIVDWKTGYKDVEPASTNWRLWGYALAVCRALDKERARIYIAYTNQPGQPIDEHALDQTDLAWFETQLAELYVRETTLADRYREGIQPTTREGSWCRHCPSKSRCASKTGLLVQVAEKGGAAIGDVELTMERAAQAHHQIERLEELVKEAKARREKWVDENGPIDLGNGRAFGRIPRTGKRILDGNKAVQAIREIVGESAQEFEAMAIERKTSQAAIERAATMLGIGQSPKKLKDRIVMRIDELGGVKLGPDIMPLGEFALDRALPESTLDDEVLDKLLEKAG